MRPQLSVQACKHPGYPMEKICVVIAESQMGVHVFVQVSQVRHKQGVDIYPCQKVIKMNIIIVNNCIYLLLSAYTFAFALNISSDSHLTRNSIQLRLLDNQSSTFSFSFGMSGFLYQKPKLWSPSPSFSSCFLGPSPAHIQFGPACHVLACGTPYRKWWLVNPCHCRSCTWEREIVMNCLFSPLVTNSRGFVSLYSVQLG